MSGRAKVISIQTAKMRKCNHGLSHLKSLEEQYMQTLLTNTAGTSFNTAGLTVLSREAMELHEQMLAKDPGFVAKALPYARTKGCARLQPILGLVKLAEWNQDLFKDVFAEVVLTPLDLQEFMTILKENGRGQGGRAVKNTVAKWLNQNLTEPWGIRCKEQKRDFSLGDIIRTTHPVPGSKRQGLLFKYLLSGVNGFRKGMIYAYEQFKNAHTPQEQIRWIREGKLPFEVVSEVCEMTPKLWNALAPDMPTGALINNLKALYRAGVVEAHRNLIEAKLTDTALLHQADISPFPLLDVFQTISAGWVKDILRQAVESTLKNLPEIPGRTAVFLDRSASMEGERLRIGSVFGLTLYKKARGRGIFWLFDTTVHAPRFSLYDSILSQAGRIRAKGGTDTAAPLRVLKEKVDNIILITDEPQDGDSPFYRELLNYRKKYNLNTQAFVIDLAARNCETKLPSVDSLYHPVCGWSDQVMQYIALTARGYEFAVKEVKNIGRLAIVNDL